jgi:hypothetical protein
MDETSIIILTSGIELALVATRPVLPWTRYSTLQSTKFMAI